MTMEFTGEAGNQEIDLGTLDPFGGLSAASWTAWANPDAVGLGNYITIVCKGSTTGNAVPWRIQMHTTADEIRVILNTGAGGNTLEGATSLSAGVWFFVVMTYDGTDKKIYLNGVEDATEAQTGSIVVSALATRIASVNTGTPRREWDGPLDDVRFYGRTLSPAEILTMYTERGVDGIVNGLLNRWRMNELAPGVAATIVDSIIDIGSGQFPGDPIASPVYAEGILR